MQPYRSIDGTRTLELDADPDQRIPFCKEDVLLSIEAKL
jgi:hypothetical protein